MTWEIGFVFVLVAFAVAMFATERVGSDVVALGVMIALLLSGILTPAEGLAGFANGATITVGAMFVLSAGLYRTGAVNIVGTMLSRFATRGRTMLLLVLILFVGPLSAFLNNTAVVAILIPVVIAVCRSSGISPSTMLIPLSYASMLGGVCTLIGTSTNILASSIAERDGLGELGMFEFSAVGGALFVIGGIYIVVLGPRLIPERRSAGDLTESFGMGEYLADLVLLPGARSVGMRIDASPICTVMKLNVIEIVRDNVKILLPTGDTVFKANDVLRIKGDVAAIAQVREMEGVEFPHEHKWSDEDLLSTDTHLVEAIVAPNSPLAGKTLAQMRFRHRYGGTVLALRHLGELRRGNLDNIRLRPGDALLIDIRKDQLQNLQRLRMFLVISEAAVTQFRKNKRLHAVAIMAAVVIAASTGMVPIVNAALGGAALMVLFNCLDVDQAYDAIDWKVIFLLAGLLGLGAGLEKTGGANMLADALVHYIGGLGPVVLMSAFLALTMVLTGVMSNNATVALLGPVAIASAVSLGVDPKPFLIAVMFGASLAFFTPVGYQTNTMVLSPGQYRFMDFARVGLPLNLILWLAASFLIPWAWPP